MSFSLISRAFRFRIYCKCIIPFIFYLLCYHWPNALFPFDFHSFFIHFPYAQIFLNFCWCFDYRSCFGLAVIMIFYDAYYGVFPWLFEDVMLTVYAMYAPASMSPLLPPLQLHTAYLCLLWCNASVSLSCYYYYYCHCCCCFEEYDVRSRMWKCLMIVSRGGHVVSGVESSGTTARFLRYFGW
jgi:hypothetical protein